MGNISITITKEVMFGAYYVPVRVVAVRVVACCVLGQPVRVESLRVACWDYRSVLSCSVLRVGIASPC